MARAGILFSDVARAASQLVETGRSPTVDNVREAMGGTGSKSTIAPMLKRWKMEHMEAAEVAGAGIPAALLGAVKNVYEALQAEADLKIEKALRQHQADLESVRAHEQQALNEKHVQVDKNAVLTAELKEAREVIADQNTERQKLNLTLASLEAEKSGLQLRLADRASEVTALKHQLTLARAQFDHYQEATAAQRAEDRSDYEQHTRHLEQDLAGVQQRLLSQQATLAQQEMQLAQLGSNNSQLEQKAANIQESLTTVIRERDQLSQRAQEAASVSQALTNQLGATQDALKDLRAALGREQKQVDLLGTQLSQAATKIDKLEDQRSLLIREQERLQAVLSRKRG